MNTPRKYRESAYFAQIQQLREDWLARVRELATSDHSPVTISRLIAEVRAFLDRDAIVVTSSGNVQAQWFQEAMVCEPKTNLTTGGFSTMGWTVPDALGAKLAADAQSARERQIDVLHNGGQPVLDGAPGKAVLQFSLAAHLSACESREVRPNRIG